MITQSNSKSEIQTNRNYRNDTADPTKNTNMEESNKDRIALLRRQRDEARDSLKQARSKILQLRSENESLQDTKADPRLLLK